MTGRQLLTTFRAKVRAKPLLFFGAALGAGLAAGGALAPRVLGRILGVGGGLAWRFLVLPTIKERVLSAVGDGGQTTKEEEHEAERH